ncbi:MAG: hypothetical protein MJ060_04615 [Clostridia bacterium]|nr:hypothetical protein [Clostridia bacterium]
MGSLYSANFIAKLTCNLPLGSRTLARINPKLEYTNTDWLLLGILNSLREKPYDPFAKPRISSKTQEEYEQLLKMPRKEIK